MIKIVSPNNEYEYDLYSLVKAFYPKEEICFERPGEKVREDLRIALLIKEDEGAAKLEITRKITDESAEMADVDTASFVMNDSYAGQITGFKNQVKLFFYDSLVTYTGRELPWGNLTGIRPTKIALLLLEQGKTAEEIEEVLFREHRVSEEKRRLGIEIAERERRILAPLDYENGYSLYIGIPFCPTTCLYCSFTSYPIRKWQGRVSEYLDCLEKEMAGVREFYPDKKLNTIYIGGGTPTALSAEELDRLLTLVEKYFSFEHLLEYTVESGRPDSITRDKLMVMRRHGVTRISVNPQTMNEETLRNIGRHHTVQETKDAFYLARECGFDNINMDIILGLPEEREEHVQRTVDEIKKLNPDSLTIHSLAIKRASKMRNFVEENGMEMLNAPEEMMRIASKGAQEMGMVPYYLYRQKNMAGNLENVGYSREGKYGIYNILIMEEKQSIVAIGAGCISKRVYPEGRLERCENVKDLAGYFERIDEMQKRRRKLFKD